MENLLTRRRYFRDNVGGDRILDVQLRSTHSLTLCLMRITRELTTLRMCIKPLQDVGNLGQKMTRTGDALVAPVEQGIRTIAASIVRNFNA